MKLLSILIISFLSLASSADLPKSFIDVLTKKDFIDKTLPKNVQVRPSVDFRAIEQRVNHFNPQDHRTFHNFYVINEELFQPGGPLIFFFYILPLVNGLAGFVYSSFGPVYDYAAELNGTIVAPEHRYYENSLVTEDISDENLKFLTIAQSLEDLAHLITSLKSEERYKDSGVILIGWDYGASYVTWFSQKYPHLVTGIWASGGRVHQTLDQHQPAEIVENTTRTFGSEECYNRSANGFRELEELLANNQSRIIERTFRLCFPLPYKDGDLDLWWFFDTLGTYFYAYAETFDPFIFENYACDQIVNAPVTHDYEALAYALGFFNIPMQLCYPISFSRDVEFVKDTEQLNEYSEARLLLYQYCNEFGYFWNSGNGNTFFGDNFPIDLLVGMCHALYGITREQMETNFARFNIFYGGRNPGVRNAYFTTGELYPWIDFGVDPELLHKTSYHEFIPDRALNTELGFEDDEEMAAVRARILTASKIWLGIAETEPTSI